MNDPLFPVRGSIDPCPECGQPVLEFDSGHFHQGAQLGTAFPCVVVRMNTENTEDLEEALRKHICRTCRCGASWVESIPLPTPEENA